MAERTGELSSSSFCQQFTMAVADFDLQALSAFLSPNATPAGVPCRRIKLNSSGTIQVVRAKDGATVTLTSRVTGEIEDIACTKVLAAGTTNGLIFTVYW